MKYLFFISLFFIFYTMIFYPIILQVLDKVMKKDKLNLNTDFNPLISIIIPAHNEEDVIERKIRNLLQINYDKYKYEIIIASDHSTDKTNDIVKDLSMNFSNIFLVDVDERKGKTNAQNEAVRFAKGEVLIFSDANSILDSDAVKQIVYYLSDKNVGYVAGNLQYTNSLESISANTESVYWNYDLKMRKIESDISSITAGNGAIYGLRKEDYIDIDPIYSHDSIFPVLQVLNGKKSKFNPQAVAYEKAGESDKEEYKRKVRMFRKIIKINFIDIQKYNFFKYGIFSYFYFSHRFCRNFLFVFHILLIFSSLFLILNPIYRVLFFLQLMFYVVSLVGYKAQIKMLKPFTFYSMTLLAQLVGAYKELTGKSKPFWEVPQSTRK